MPHPIARFGSFQHGIRFGAFAFAVLLSLFALVLLATYLWLPQLAADKAQIERRLSAGLSQPVTVDRVQAHWDGIHPGLRLHSVNVLSASAEPVVRVEEVRASVAWLPLLWGEVALHQLTLSRPRLLLQRSSAREVGVPGLVRPAARADRSPVQLVDWLLAQPKLAIAGAELVWHDRGAGEEPLSISDINITLKNAGRRHHLEVSARFPEALCRECAVSVHAIGDPRQRASWGGETRLRVAGLNLEALPAIIRDAVPYGLGGNGLTGVIDTNMWTQWQHGEARAVSGKLHVRGLHLPATRWSTSTVLQEASADVNWKSSRAGWQLYLDNADIAEAGRTWLWGRAHVSADADEIGMQVQHLDASGLASLLSVTKSENAGIQLLRTLNPAGTISRLDLRLHGLRTGVIGYRAEADVADAALAPYRRFPGVSGVSGHIKLDEAGGKFVVKRYRGSLAFPHVFRAPLELDEGAGEFQWKKTEAEWRLAGKRLMLRNGDGRGTAQFEFVLPRDKAKSPWISLQAHIPAAQGKNAALYYPVNVLPEKVRLWLERFAVDGAVQNAKVVLEGELRKFPFKDGGGKFEVRGEVRKGVFDYLPGWPRIHDATAEFRFSGSAMHVEGNGRIRDLAVRNLVADIPDLRAPDGVQVQLHGQATGPLNSTLAVLREAGKDKWAGGIPPDLDARGDGVLDLAVLVPLRDAQDFRLDVAYALEHGALALPGSGLVAEDVSGKLRFTERGISDGSLTAHLLGGHTVLNVTNSGNRRTPRIRASMDGEMTSAGIVRVLGPGFAPYFAGSAPWKGALDLHHGLAKMDLEANLAPMVLKLPAPLDKPQGVPMRLTVHGQARAQGPAQIEMMLDNQVAAKARLERDSGAWRLARAHLHMGNGPATLPVQGVNVTLDWPYADGDRWLALVRAVGPREGDARSETSGPRQTSLVDHVDQVRVSVGNLDLFQRSLGKLGATLTREGSNRWAGTVRGKAATGSVHVIGGSGSRVVQLNFEHLIIPIRNPATPTLTAVVATGPAPRPSAGKLPTVSIQSQHLELGNWKLGKLALWGTPTEHGWGINYLVLSRPEMNVFIKGAWSITPDQQKTDLELDLRTEDIGATLAAFGIHEQIRRGRAELQAKASWEGAPTDFSLGHLHADVHLAAEKGQFLKMQQGAGKLLGLFDIRSVARYMSLDFSSIFGKGYAFDNITGRVSIDRGQVLTRGIEIEGPSADIQVAGRAGLVEADFDLEVGVVPHLRGSMALFGGLTGGPVGVGTALLLERIWKKQLAEGSRLVYTVQGGWESPIVKRVLREPAADLEQE